MLFQNDPHELMAFSRPQPVAGALTPSFTSSASQNSKNRAPGPVSGDKDCQSARLIRTGLIFCQYKLCPKEVDQGLASRSKVIDMREIAKSKSFLQTLHTIRIILVVELVEVCNDSLNVGGTILGHVFTDRREVPVIIAAQIGG